MQLPTLRQKIETSLSFLSDILIYVCLSIQNPSTPTAIIQTPLQCLLIVKRREMKICKGSFL